MKCKTPFPKGPKGTSTSTLVNHTLVPQRLCWGNDGNLSQRHLNIYPG